MNSQHIFWLAGQPHTWHMVCPAPASPLAPDWSLMSPPGDTGDW